MKIDVLKYLTLHSAEDKLELAVFAEKEGHVIEGVLKRKDGYWYPILQGVPTLLEGELRPDFSQFRDRHGLSDIPEDWPSVNYGTSNMHRHMSDWHERKIDFMQKQLYSRRDETCSACFLLQPESEKFKLKIENDNNYRQSKKIEKITTYHYQDIVILL